MSGVVFPSGSTDHCFNCNLPGDPVLRQCSQCRIARYCSANCQRENWNVHKMLCSSHAQLFTGTDPRSVADVRLFVRWLDFWRDSLLSWAVFAADLANQEENYLVNHWCVVVPDVPSC